MDITKIMRCHEYHLVGVGVFIPLVNFLLPFYYVWVYDWYIPRFDVEYELMEAEL
jgi:hypothetical protein